MSTGDGESLAKWDDRLLLPLRSGDDEVPLAAVLAWRTELVEPFCCCSGGLSPSLMAAKLPGSMLLPWLLSPLADELSPDGSKRGGSSSLLLLEDDGREDGLSRLYAAMGS